jgi:hypothetical protein
MERLTLVPARDVKSIEDFFPAKRVVGLLLILVSLIAVDILL